MIGKDLAALRRDYSLQELSRSSVDPDPFAQFSKWMEEALNSEILDATAMTVATVDGDCRPSVRVVLLKEFSTEGFVFFTNYESRKGRDLQANPQAVLHFFWPVLERQITVSGTAEKTSAEISDAYFRSRPAGSRIGAWASRQSSVVASRNDLEKKAAEIEEKFAGGEIPRPPFWGGFRVTPQRFEFWQGRANRLHDRIEYVLENENWVIARLSP